MPSLNFLDKNPFFSIKPGFKPGGFCINQLIAITHEIFKGFDDGLEVRGIFLNISKSFDKVWHEGNIYKFCCNSLSGKLLQLLLHFLDSRKQCVLLTVQF